jgi:hypothetical protein
MDVSQFAVSISAGDVTETWSVTVDDALRRSYPPGVPDDMIARNVHRRGLSVPPLRSTLDASVANIISTTRT